MNAHFRTAVAFLFTASPSLVHAAPPEKPLPEPLPMGIPYLYQPGNPYWYAPAIPYFYPYPFGAAPRSTAAMRGTIPASSPADSGGR